MQLPTGFIDLYTYKSLEHPELEHIVCSNAMAHLDEHELLSDMQHAFRNRHRCEKQLSTIISDWAKRHKLTFILDFDILL